MRLSFFAAVLSALLLVACGSGSSSPDASSSAGSFPMTMEGEFEGVGGGMEADGTPFYFGGLSIGAGESITVKASEAVFKAAGLMPEAAGLPSSGGAKVRVTLGSQIEFLDQPMYVATAIQRL